MAGRMHEHMQSSGDSAMIEQQKEMLGEERSRADKAQKAANEERSRADKAQRKMTKEANEERHKRDKMLFKLQSQTAILNSSITLAAVGAINGRVVASSAGPVTAHSATVRSATEATLFSWLISNHILAADSEWDAKALISEGCTEGQDILLMDEKEWTAVGFKAVHIRKLVVLKKAAAVA